MLLAAAGQVSGTLRVAKVKGGCGVDRTKPFVEGAGGRLAGG